MLQQSDESEVRQVEVPSDNDERVERDSVEVWQQELLLAAINVDDDDEVEHDEWDLMVMVIMQEDDENDCCDIDDEVQVDTVLMVIHEQLMMMVVDVVLVLRQLVLQLRTVDEDEVDLGDVVVHEHELVEQWIYVMLVIEVGE